MSDEIPLYPSIPNRLRLAAKQGTLIPFIGAGVSQLGGCPGWDEFANATLQFFVQEGKVSHAQLDQLTNLSARVKLAVALGLEHEHGLLCKFDELLRPPDDHRKVLGDRVYSSLSRLASTFITTNYDEWLDKIPSGSPMVSASSASPASDPPTTFRTVIYKLEEFDDEKLKTPNTVLHIHGSVRDRKSMVLTTADYLERYNADDFIEELDRLVDISPAKISAVLGKVLETFVPTFDFQDRLKFLLTKLATHGRREEAISFANRLRHLRGMEQLFAQLTADS